MTLRSLSCFATATIVATGIACASPTIAPRSTVAPAPSTLSTNTALSPAQRHWVDSTLASLSLRQRVGQMIVVWMLGDYTNTRDSAYAQLVRWVEHDGVGGATVSLGTPVEVA